MNIFFVCQMVEQNAAFRVLASLIFEFGMISIRNPNLHLQLVYIQCRYH